MHLFIRTTKVSKTNGLENLTNLFKIPSLPSEFDSLTFEQMLKISAVVVGTKKIDFLHVVKRTDSLLCLIIESILLPIDVKNSFNLEQSGIV